jgi:pimeloyl-ACP methyl ester carboxylesterase
MATFVLVHGGGHGGWCYQRVARRLRAEGHDVHTPSMTGLAERSHLLHTGIDLDHHVRDIVEVLHYEDLRDVVLVGHSYGGMVITGVADRAADRIGKLVYLDAANPVNGQSLLDVAGPIIEAVRPMGEVVDGVELVLLPAPEAGRFYGVTDPETLAWMADRLTGHPWRCFEQKLELTNEDALVGDPAIPHRLHLDPGHAGSPADGDGAEGRPPLGRRHRPRPHAHRAGVGHRRAVRGRR